ncbi:hypothetical protein [Streptomyces xanthophaeus]|uniref:hypothetical protein n=1 Tax=Streptomyces xanthophaeus TaxID=67385 RepID=UPI000AB286CA|nr:hypothetical protein [Streptomyces xanthophaeus]
MGERQQTRGFHASYAPDGRTLATTVGPDAHQLRLGNVVRLWRVDGAGLPQG